MCSPRWGHLLNVVTTYSKRKWQIWHRPAPKHSLKKCFAERRLCFGVLFFFFPLLFHLQLLPSLQLGWQTGHWPSYGFTGRYCGRWYWMNFKIHYEWIHIRLGRRPSFCWSADCVSSPLPPDSLRLQNVVFWIPLHKPWSHKSQLNLTEALPLATSRTSHFHYRRKWLMERLHFVMSCWSNWGWKTFGWVLVYF